MSHEEDRPEPPIDGAGTFATTGQKYDDFMGRYSSPLAVVFADMSGVRKGMSVLDVGCGPGALTGVLAERVGAQRVSACDPSAPFVQECARRHPGVQVRHGRAEAIPFPDDAFDLVFSQLVLHFISDPAVAGSEARRVLRPGGVTAACVWDAEGMQVLNHFWEAALNVGPDIPARGRALRLGGAGEMAALFNAAGFEDVQETTLTVTSTYVGFEELWSGFLAGIGPAGAYCLSLSADARTEVRSAMFRSLGSPTGSLELAAVARCAVGRAPS